MTVTSIAPHATCPTEPLAVVPKPRPVPMNAVIFAHADADADITAVRRTANGPVELAVGNPSVGTHVVLFLDSDADVIRLIAALQSVYSS